MRYYSPKVGEWFRATWRNQRIACCDCDLVHKMDFTVRKGKLLIRAFRDERATAMKRVWAKRRAKCRKNT